MCRTWTLRSGMHVAFFSITWHKLCLYMLHAMTSMVEYRFSIILTNLIHLFFSFPRVVNPSFAQDVALRSFQPSVWLLHFRLISLSDHVVFTGAEHFQHHHYLHISILYHHHSYNFFLVWCVVCCRWRSGEKMVDGMLLMLLSVWHVSWY